MSKPGRRSLTEGDVRGHLLRLVGPMTLGIAASMTTGLVDAFWLARLGVAELAAVSFAFPVTMATFSVAIGLGAGAASVISRAAGRGDRARVARLTTDSILLSLIIVAIVSAAGLASLRPLFSALGASDALMPHIEAYMSVWYVGVIFVVGPLMANNVLRALGDPVAPMILMMSVALVNLILDPLLIFGIGPFPRLEVFGAALATLIANLVAFVGAAYLIAIKEKLIVWTRPAWAELASSWREVARIGVPAAGSNMINPIAMALIFASLIRFGEAAVAGFGAASRIDMVAIIPLFALSASIGPVVGQNAGAERFDRVREAFIESFKIATIWALIAGALLALLRQPIAAAFTDDPDAQAAMSLYLLIVPITAAGYGAAMAAAAGFNGLGKPLPGVAMTVARSMFLFAPGAWIGGSIGGYQGALIGMAAANVIAWAAIVAWTLTAGAPRVPQALAGQAGP